MNELFYKKSGMVISKISRDLLVTDVGSRLPSLNTYADKLFVSRGVIQQAFAFLVAEKCIEIEKSHSTGTTLKKINLEKLIETTGWDILTINLPVPATHSLSSLTSALYHHNSVFPIPLAMVYVTGSENRLHYLKKNIYDATIVSAASAKCYCSQCSFLDEPLFLSSCQYAERFYAYFSNPKYTQIEHGMRVGYDPTSLDHYHITQLMCQSKDVIWVKTPFVMLSDTLKAGKVDVIFVRREYPMLQFDLSHPQPINIPDFSLDDMLKPALLFNKHNYGMRSLFKKYLSLPMLHDVQYKVLSGKMDVRFF